MKIQNFALQQWEYSLLYFVCYYVLKKKKKECSCGTYTAKKTRKTSRNWKDEKNKKN